jgi:DNA-binding response OmpR family regulator
MRAVVADDDRGTSTIVANLLKRSNLEVAVAHDGNAAWDLLMAAPPPALAIIDWMMPGVDGLELCRRIKREPSLANTHVILLTAKNNQQDVLAAIQAGANDYIVKPFKFEELSTRVHAGLRLATLQERVVASVAELQAAQQSAGASGPVNASAQSHRSWLKLARDGVARSGRYRRAIGDLVQAADEATGEPAAPDDDVPHESKPESPGDP